MERDAPWRPIIDQRSNSSNNQLRDFASADDSERNQNEFQFLDPSPPFDSKFLAIRIMLLRGFAPLVLR